MSENNPKSDNRLQTCDQTCYHCAQTWFMWLKAREAQMSTPMKDKLQRRSQPGSKDYYLKRGTTMPWSEAAATSNVPSKEDL